MIHCPPKEILGMKRGLPFALLLAVAMPLSAQSITLPVTLNVPKPGLIILTPLAVDADDVAWTSVDDGLQLIPSAVLKDGRTACGVVLQPGSYRVRAVAAKVVGAKAVLSAFAECVVTVGGVPPAPGPGPGPLPPGPVPPGPAPIPAAGLRVLIIYDAKTQTALSADQQAILFGRQFRDALKTKTVVGVDGKTREFRIWPDGVATDGEAKLWQDAMSRARTKLPWILISNGVAGYEGPLPATVDEALTLLAKYEGK